ncbi:Hypothetical protein NTJ_01932 [Nesidiocoris tenuis]|uniref:Uncharacterized protein n=1 Tax=Nesidiocoris tenuis TaxID=355587 RepID=A0ABN7A9Z3_9HEMI|nr:Hypothetical protein NTJ_01932 [Nesidiocoris tenuis]
MLKRDPENKLIAPSPGGLFDLVPSRLHQLDIREQRQSTHARLLFIGRTPNELKMRTKRTATIVTKLQSRLHVIRPPRLASLRPGTSNIEYRDYTALRESAYVDFQSLSLVGIIRDDRFGMIERH